MPEPKDLTGVGRAAGREARLGRLLKGIGGYLAPTARRGPLPHRRRLLRVVVLGWGIAIALAASVAGHTALELLTAEIPVIAGVWLAHSPRAGGRIGAVALSLALVAVAASSALILRQDTAAMGLFAAAIVLACWLEDRAAAAAAAAAVVGVQALVQPLTLQAGTFGTNSLLVLGVVLLAAVGPWRYNAQRERDLTRDRENLSKLVAVSRSVGSSDDPRGALVAGLIEFAQADMASLCELGDDGTELVVTSSSFAPVLGTRFPTSGSGSGVATAFASRRSLFITDVLDHPLVQQRLVEVTGIRTVLYEPVFVEGEAVGILTVGWRTVLDDVHAHRRHLVALAAGEAATAMRRHAATRELHTQALTDPLTGVMNRRAFDAHLPMAMRSAAELGQPLALVGLDLNGFKALNDTLGHAAGDRVLRDCVRLWQAELQPGDMLARLGGDEFAVVLPGRADRAADEIAGRMRSALLGAGEVGTASGTVVWNGTESAAQLMERADQRLYADKAATRPSRRITAEGVERTGLLDLPTDPEIQRLTDTLRQALGTPLAMFSLLTDTTQHVIAHSADHATAFVPDELPTLGSFCELPTATGRELAIEDVASSDVLMGHPAVASARSGDHHAARAYAGVPIMVGGRIFGSVCGIDTRPREWTPAQLGALRLAGELAAQYLAQINAGLAVGLGRTAP